MNVLVRFERVNIVLNWVMRMLFMFVVIFYIGKYIDSRMNWKNGV